MSTKTINVGITKANLYDRMSEETNCFKAVITLNGKAVGEISNNGQGAPSQIYWKDKEAGKEIEEWAATLPDPYAGEEWHKGKETSWLTKLEEYLENLVIEDHDNKRLKRLCKKSVLFIVEGDDPNTMRTLKCAYDAKARAHLQQKYGAKLKEIINDRFA